MDKLFITQLALSFFIGGGLVAILSLIAERVNHKIAGIILSSPSTILLGFFFLGWTTSPEAVAEVAPSTLIPLAVSSIFATSYSYIAEYLERFTNNRKIQILISFVIGISIWLSFAIPIIIFEINNLLVGIIGYFLLISIVHLLLRKKSHEKPVALKYTLGQKIGRAIFVGLIIFTVVLLGKTLNPFWGGIFVMFPAAFSSTLLLIHYYYGQKMLFPTIQKIPFGSLSLFVYTIVVMLTFPLVGFIWGTIIAYISSIIVIAIFISKKFQSLIHKL